MRSPGGPAGDDDGVTGADAGGWQAVRVTAITRNGHLTPDSTLEGSRDYEAKLAVPRLIGGGQSLSPALRCLRTRGALAARGRRSPERMGRRLPADQHTRCEH